MCIKHILFLFVRGLAFCNNSHSSYCLLSPIITANYN